MGQSAHLARVPPPSPGTRSKSPLRAAGQESAPNLVHMQIRGFPTIIDVLESFYAAADQVDVAFVVCLAPVLCRRGLFLVFVVVDLTIPEDEVAGTPLFDVLTSFQ